VPEPTPFTLLASGDWLPGQVITSWTSSSRVIVAEVEQIIEETWKSAQRPGRSLFDGPMCRLESWEIKGNVASPSVPEAGELHLRLSPTSYKPFFGTHLSHSELADRFGLGVLPNPVGLSAAVISSDDHLILGRRNDRVAYYPNRIHPFAGSLEPKDGSDVFDAMRRELHEEIGLTMEDIEDIRCAGIAQDNALRQPELIFPTRLKLRRAEVEARLDAGEHHGCIAIPLREEDLKARMNDPAFTPIAAATVFIILKILRG
jgi:8-oxo-dGTP pyrophosphatase MutT (NUDIX family)